MSDDYVYLKITTSRRTGARRKGKEGDKERIVD